MTALACVAQVNPNALYRRLPEIIDAYKKGSVITIDNSISVFAWLCKASEECQATVFPLLIDHLATCRAKEIPQHAERMAVCIDQNNKGAFLEVINTRENELSDSQKSRLAKLKRNL